MKTPTERNRGFVLITSLIFLVIVTLLGVSAINSSTLQEKMALNARERVLALQVANAALRQGERLLQQSEFNTYQPHNEPIDVKFGTESGTKTVTLKILDDTQDTTDGATKFLDSDIWDSSNTKDGEAEGDTVSSPMSYTPYSDADDPTASAEYYIAEYDFRGRDLSPDTAAVGDGAVIYRITARGEGKDPSAVVVTQSRYAKYY